MRLARVTHIRCHQRDFNEPETYVWVDELMTQEEFDLLVKAAQKAYDQAGADFEKAEQPPYADWGMPPYHKFPDKTAAEVKAVHEAAQTAYKEWQERKREIICVTALLAVTMSIKIKHIAQKDIHILLKIQFSPSVSVYVRRAAVLMMQKGDRYERR